MPWCFGPGGAVSGWWWVMMPLGMVLFWGIVIGAAVWAIRRFTRWGSDRPLEIARERYARGELSREEYEQVRRDLSVPTAPGDRVGV